MVSITHFAEVFELNDVLYGLSVIDNQTWAKWAGPTGCDGKNEANSP